jgi:hypothetical protein
MEAPWEPRRRSTHGRKTRRQSEHIDVNGYGKLGTLETTQAVA